MSAMICFVTAATRSRGESVLAEGYTMRLGSVGLDLTSRSGFATDLHPRSFLECVSVVRSRADTFCLHCNILIYIRHIWIKPVLCSRMVSLFHHTSPWTHRCLQTSLSAHRNGRVFRRSVQTAWCCWILNRGKSSSNWNSKTNASRL